MTRPSGLVGAALLGAVVLASPASANIPTTILWPILAHLVVGNLVIGLVEGLVVSVCLRVPPGRAVGVMLAANYLSALAGVVVEVPLLVTLGNFALGPKPLYNVVPATVVVAAAFGAFSALVEWPFPRWLLRDRPGSWQKALPVVVAAQLVSYALLVPYYIGASQLGVFRNLKSERSAAVFASNRNVWVYFLSPADGQIHRIRIDGTGAEAVGAKGDRDPHSWLAFRPGARSGAVDLLLARPNPDEPNSKPQWVKTVLLQDITGSGGSPERSAPFGGINYYWLDEKSVVDFRAPGLRRRNVCADMFPWYGLMVQDDVKDFKRTMRGDFVALETPFFRWPARCPTMLPGDQVVFQLGDQVVIADLPTRRIAFLARGRGPAVLMNPPRTTGVGRSQSGTWLPLVAMPAFFAKHLRG